jgi:aspartyl/glutamyl-tRNA(Asn/Gln) amidotransferase C subunit
MKTEQLRQLAALVHVHLEPEEESGLAGELTSMLGHLDVLRAVENRPEPDPPRSTDARARLREDEPGADRLAMPAEEIAPAWHDGYFLVPRAP